MSDALEIIMFPCLADNYGFLVHDPKSGQTASIDTPDSAEIARQCESRGWTLSHIWNTHHHFDHAGGNLNLAEKYDLEIFGCENDRARIPGMTRGFSNGDAFEFAGHTVKVFETPGHTIGHIIFYLPEMEAAFVGDTIFVLGCGRLFEGSPADMYASLKLISDLPDTTRLYCAHEYTLSNGRFALTAEPENTDLADYMKTAQTLRDQGIPTVPTTVAMEKKTNPFVRASSPEELGRIRAAKDSF